jgi:hypothetical protein
VYSSSYLDTYELSSTGSLYTLPLSVKSKVIMNILKVLWALKSHSDFVKVFTGIWLDSPAVYTVHFIQHFLMTCVRYGVRTLPYTLFREDLLDRW